MIYSRFTTEIVGGEFVITQIEGSEIPPCGGQWCDGTGSVTADYRMVKLTEAGA